VVDAWNLYGENTTVSPGVNVWRTGESRYECQLSDARAEIGWLAVNGDGKGLNNGTDTIKCIV